MEMMWVQPHAVWSGALVAFFFSCGGLLVVMQSYVPKDEKGDAYDDLSNLPESPSREDPRFRRYVKGLFDVPLVESRVVIDLD